MEHDLKIWPEFFNPVLSGEKTFEVRQDDKGYRAGDILNLREWKKSARYTGRTFKVIITYVLSGIGLKPGWVAMAIKPHNQKDSADGSCPLYVDYKKSCKEWQKNEAERSNG